ncbi:hypothetical protein [Nocardia gipuzkoensis]|uniref:hypothetical protein n=1 Tax=Nocardia gipuzkoensis TaxID=2749991 RepID=UPI001F1A5290|nr:hypothetical protein [Nocardia gipuzkoensis]
MQRVDEGAEVIFGLGERGLGFGGRLGLMVVGGSGVLDDDGLYEWVSGQGVEVVLG